MEICVRNLGETDIGPLGLVLHSPGGKSFSEKQITSLRSFVLWSHEAWSWQGRALLF